MQVKVTCYFVDHRKNGNGLVPPPICQMVVKFQPSPVQNPLDPTPAVIHIGPEQERALAIVKGDDVPLRVARHKVEVFLAIHNQRLAVKMTVSANLT